MTELVDAAALLVAVVLVQTVPAVEVWKTHATPVLENNPM